MLRSSIPTRFLLPWAANAAGAYIRNVPVSSQIGIQDGAASYNDGFVPDNFTAIAAGGVPPFGQDFNGVLKDMTAWDQWYQAGSYIPYDQAFATQIGGYPSGAILDSTLVLGAQWCSIADNNLTNPDDPLTSANWRRVGLPPGTPVPFFTTDIPRGFVAMNTLTIGAQASGASFSVTEALFCYVANWLNFPNTSCPIYNSTGVPTTRGANAVADFFANKRLATPDGRGLSLISADQGGSGYLNSVPVVSGNRLTPGSIIGENLHSLTASENAAHIHANAPADSGHTHVNAPADSGHTHANAPEDGGHAHTATTLDGAQVISNAGSTQGFAPGSRGQIAITQGFSIDIGHANIAANNASAIANIVANNASAIANIAANNASSGSGVGHNTVERSMVVIWGQVL